MNCWSACLSTVLLSSHYFVKPSKIWLSLLTAAELIPPFPTNLPSYSKR